MTTYKDADITGEAGYAITDSETAMHTVFYGAVAGFAGVMLDDATDFTVTRIYRFTNHADGAIDIYNGADALIGSIPIGKCAQVSLRDRSTVAGDWKVIVAAEFIDLGNNGVAASDGSGVIDAVTMAANTVLGMDAREIVAIDMPDLRLMLAGAAWQIFENNQSVAADASARVVRVFTAGSIGKAWAETGVAAAAGESMTFDITINGVSCLTAPISIDSTIAIDTPVEGTIDTDHNEYVAGDLIKVVRDYTSGGNPAPMSNTTIGLAITP